MPVLFEHARDDFCWNNEERVENCPLVAGLFCFWKPEPMRVCNVNEADYSELCRKAS